MGDSQPEEAVDGTETDPSLRRHMKERGPMIDTPRVLRKKEISMDIDNQPTPFEYRVAWILRALAVLFVGAVVGAIVGVIAGMVWIVVVGAPSAGNVLDLTTRLSPIGRGAGIGAVLGLVVAGLTSVFPGIPASAGRIWASALSGTASTEVDGNH
jgi:hypothetical protein